MHVQVRLNQWYLTAVLVPSYEPSHYATFAFHELATGKFFIAHACLHVTL